MNNEDFYSADFTNSLPPALKNDPDMMALAQTISAQLQTTAAEIRKNIIYARIDELDEATLDVLAYVYRGGIHRAYTGRDRPRLLSPHLLQPPERVD